MRVFSFFSSVRRTSGPVSTAGRCGAAGLAVIDASTGQSRTITTPRGATVSSPAWSPDGKQIAFVANFDDASRVYVADVATGASRQVTNRPLLATLVTGIDWTADGKSVVAVFLPDGRFGSAARSRPARSSASPTRRRRRRASTRASSATRSRRSSSSTSPPARSPSST